MLKDKRRAQPHARRALQLAQALYPKQFTQEGWYRDCLALLARYQADAVAEDDAEAAALRAPFLEVRGAGRRGGGRLGKGDGGLRRGVGRWRRGLGRPKEGRWKG